MTDDGGPSHMDKVGCPAMRPHSENLAPPGTGAVVTVSKSFGDRAPDLAGIVAGAMRAVLGDDVRLVHAKVKRAGTVTAFGVEHRGQLFTFKQKQRAVAFARSKGVRSMSRLSRPPEPGIKGWAYDGIPFSALPGCRYLVSITIGSDRPLYPVTLRNRKTVPIELHDPTEELVAIAAHEAHHCHQYVNDLSRSEVACDRAALAVLDDYRAGGFAYGTPVPA